MIAAASIALVQLEAAKSGKPSIITVGVASTAAAFQFAVSGAAGGVRAAFGSIADVPHLYAQTRRLAERNQALARANAALREQLARVPDREAVDRAAFFEPNGIIGSAIGYDPENQSRVVTLDVGSHAGVRPGAGVIDEDGVVGRVIEAEPFSSKVLLVTDLESKVPAVVQRGRWWGIATGTNSRIALQYVSQDAKLRVGDVVVTGEGRSFHAGYTLGTIRAIYHPEGALYQTALVEPAVAFGRLGNVIVLPHI